MKNKRSDRIRIANPVPGGGAFTSYRAAMSHFDRGHGEFVSEDEFRFYTEAEMIHKHGLRVEAEKDRQLWREIEVQRGGKVSFEWRPSMGFNGFTGMEGRPVVTK